MLGFHNNSFDPRTLLDLETAFDEAWFNAQIDWQHKTAAMIPIRKHARATIAKELKGFRKAVSDRKKPD